MGLLDNVERGLERIVNGAFAKTFRSGLQPVEITSALKREMDTNAAVVSRERVLVPNRFSVRVSTADFERLNRLGATLIDELTSLVQKHAKTQQYQFAGPIAIVLRPDATLTEGMLAVDASTEQGEISWLAVLDIGTKRVPLKPGRLVLGRGSEADVTIDDSGASRKHAVVEWDGERARVRDLGSTNGTTLNGAPLTEAILEPDSVIAIGRTQIIFRLLARAKNGPSAPQADGFWG